MDSHAFRHKKPKKTIYMNKNLKKDLIFFRKYEETYILLQSGQKKCIFSCNHKRKS